MKTLLLLLALLLQQTATKPLSITVVQHQAVLNWTATASSGITGYNVYRSTTSGSGYTKIGSTNSSTVTYTDTTVQGSATYYFVVTAYSPACPTTPTCGESPNSNEVVGVIPAP